MIYQQEGKAETFRCCKRVMLVQRAEQDKVARNQADNPSINVDILFQEF